jgi:hypothetical protein
MARAQGGSFESEYVLREEQVGIRRILRVRTHVGGVPWVFR